MKVKEKRRLTAEAAVGTAHAALAIKAKAVPKKRAVRRPTVRRKAKRA